MLNSAKKEAATPRRLKSNTNKSGLIKDKNNSSIESWKPKTHASIDLSLPRYGKNQRSEGMQTEIYMDTAVDRAPRIVDENAQGPITKVKRRAAAL